MQLIETPMRAPVKTNLQRDRDDFGEQTLWEQEECLTQVMQMDRGPTREALIHLEDEPFSSWPARLCGHIVFAAIRTGLRGLGLHSLRTPPKRLPV